MTQQAGDHGAPPGRRRGRRGGGGDGRPVVPDADFTSYYGRPVVKAAPWVIDIPIYFFFGGLAGGSSLLAAGADVTDRPVLRRAGRVAALSSTLVSLVALVHDLGKPSRALNMLRVFKPTSPMSVGTWALTAFGPNAGVAAVAEIARLTPLHDTWAGRMLDRMARPTGLAAAAVAPVVATYTGVLVSDTATPLWSEGRREMPVLFAASGATAAAGLGMIAAPVAETGPARRMAVIAGAADLVADYSLERSAGLAAETLHQGTAGWLTRSGRILTAAGAVGAAVLGGRSRIAGAVSGAALIAGAIGTKFGIFYAGQESARDPKYTVVPQRERLNRRNRAGADDHASAPDDDG